MVGYQNQLRENAVVQTELFVTIAEQPCDGNIITRPKDHRPSHIPLNQHDQSLGYLARRYVVELFLYSQLLIVNTKLALLNWYKLFISACRYFVLRRLFCLSF